MRNMNWHDMVTTIDSGKASWNWRTMLVVPILLMVVVAPGRAQQPSWAPNGVGPFPPLSRSNVSTLTHDGFGGACLWTYGYAPGWKAIRLVRLTAAGVPDPSWPVGVL